jgi:hypothetical protein
LSILFLLLYQIRFYGTNLSGSALQIPLGGLADRPSVPTYYTPFWAENFAAVFCQTIFTIYKVPMACWIRAIHVIFGSFPARIAYADYRVFCIVRIETHRHPRIKNIQFALEILIGIFLHIAHDAAIELIHVCKPLCN